jgi:flagellar protein FliO/FliZ
MTFVTPIVVIALLAGAAWALRRYLPSRRARQTIAVETAVPLGERRSLVIVSVEGRRLLLGLAPGHIGLVTELGASFAQSLDRSIEDARP